MKVKILFPSLEVLQAVVLTLSLTDIGEYSVDFPNLTIEVENELEAVAELHDLGFSDFEILRDDNFFRDAVIASINE